MSFQQHTTRGSSKSGEGSTDSGSAVNTLSNTPESPTDHRQPPPRQMDSAGGIDSPRISGSHSHPAAAKAKPAQEKKRGPGSNSDEVLDAKTLRRLAQNREAARKSRLRKKAYVQQLESSRIRLAQMEQDLQRARSQGLFLGGGGAASGSINSGAAAKSDVFHLITGMWTTPAERCFLWMGGFRPSDLIKMLIPQLGPLTEQQFMGICSLQHSSQQAEEALSQGLEQLQQSLVDTIANGSVNDNMQHMAMALGKLANLEGFVRQADNLRQQTLHQLHRLLTIRQAARCFLVIGDYYGRLRALSSLWASRPRESMIAAADDNSCQTTTDLQMVHSSQNHFSIF
ncbi:transcription factor TGA9-like isoform X2 [Salvia hispanica]|uniref:transcription factor TGA9-like isoform X2 n=1 Tax=Salvia hispanica TaxID=49212 RepID=UPI0020091B41|nr:transcription factor TGA9-like isoform X2 [Salvia hispanica]